MSTLRCHTRATLPAACLATFLAAALLIQPRAEALDASVVDTTTASAAVATDDVA